jgi:hypothetical protein
VLVNICVMSVCFGSLNSSWKVSWKTPDQIFFPARSICILASVWKFTPNSISNGKSSVNLRVSTQAPPLSVYGIKYLIMWDSITPPWRPPIDMVSYCFSVRSLSSCTSCGYLCAISL